MDEKELKVSEIINELNAPERALADSNLEDERISRLFEELEESVPFSLYKDQLLNLEEKVKKIEQSVDRLEYFVRGLQIGDVLQKLSEQSKKKRCGERSESKNSKRGRAKK